MANSDTEREIDPSGRVSLVRAADMRLPAVCVMCGRGSYNVDELFLDIQVDIDQHGTLYFCEECGAEVGFAAGNAKRDDYEALAIANEQLTEENEKYEKMVERLGAGFERDILAWLDNRGISVPPNVTAGVPSSDSDSSNDDNSEFLYGNFGDSDGATDGAVNDVADESADVTEPATVEGSDDVTESPSSNKSEYQPLIEL